MEPKFLSEIFSSYGWPGIFAISLCSIVVFVINILNKRSSEKTSSALDKGFEKMSTSIAEQNNALISAMVKQNETNNTNLVNIIDKMMEKRDRAIKDEYNRNLDLRKDVSFRIKSKIHDLLYKYNCDRAFILEFHNSKQNMTGLSFLWYDMTFEEIAKGVSTIQSFWKDQEASSLLPVVKDINDEDGFKIYTVDDLEALQHTSSVLYHRLRIERKLQEAIMVGLYGSNNEIIGILILEYEDSLIPVEILDREQLVAEGNCISELLDYGKLKNENV